MRRKGFLAVALATALFAAYASAAYAHECVNVHKTEGAGQEAIAHNGGVAGYVLRPDGVEVFIHPSVSHDPFLSTLFSGAPGQFKGKSGEAGSLPEGAHESAGWDVIPFGGGE